MPLQSILPQTAELYFVPREEVFVSYNINRKDYVINKYLILWLQWDFFFNSKRVAGLNQASSDKTWE